MSSEESSDSSYVSEEQFSHDISDSEKDSVEVKDTISESNDNDVSEDAPEISEKDEENEDEQEEENEDVKESEEEMQEKIEKENEDDNLVEEDEASENDEISLPTPSNLPPSYNPPPPSYMPNKPNTDDVKLHSFFKVYRNYTPDEDESDVLKLKRGEIIIFLSKVDEEWYKGQLGEDIGLFRVDHVEPITEEEVKKFITKQAIRNSTYNQGPSKTKEALKEEMKQLKDEEDNTNEEIEKLTQEIEEIKIKAAKSRKDLRMNLSQSMEVLPAALYHIDAVECLRFDIMKIIIDLENLIEFENGESKETITVLSEQINVFLTTLSIFQQNADSKFKIESEKVQTQARMFLSGLLNEMSSYDPSATINMIKELETLYEILGNEELIQQSVEKSEALKNKKKKKKEKTSKTKTPSEKKTKKKKKTKKGEKS